MNRIIITVDRWVHRAERAGWIFLGTIALLAPWFGIEPPILGTHGEGYILMDIVVTGALLAATAAQIVRLVQMGQNEHVLNRIAAWLLLFTLCLISGRLVWILATIGDVRMTTTMGISLLCLSTSVMLHVAGHVIYGGAGEK